MKIPIIIEQIVNLLRFGFRIIKKIFNMLRHSYVLVYIFIHWVDHSSSLICYFQRCNYDKLRGWYCNYDGKGVEIKCEHDEVCFEETHRPWSLEIEMGNYAILMERNCRSTAVIRDELVLLKPLTDQMFPMGDEGFLNEYLPEWQYAYTFGNEDRCNDKLGMPPSFEIAESLYCHHYSCTKYWRDPYRNRCTKEERKFCGSGLDWACFQDLRTERKLYLNHSCIHRDEIDESLEPRPGQIGKLCFSFPNSILDYICYCFESLCNVSHHV